MASKTTAPVVAEFIPPPPVDPYAHLYVDELPAQSRAARDRTNTPEDDHVAALLTSGRAGLRIPLDHANPGGQRGRYQRAAKRVERSAYLIAADDHVILTLRDAIKRPRTADGVRVG